MAIMIPNIDPEGIDNCSERSFYRAAKQLPLGYTVLYSYKFKDKQRTEDFDVICEADFVIVHPAIGFIVVEVKSGEIDYRNGIWSEYKGGSYCELHRNPVEQVRNATFAILNAYTRKADEKFPLPFKYAIAFPECSRLQGDFPSDLNPNSVFLSSDMIELENKILDLFKIKEPTGQRDSRNTNAITILLDKVLAPSFKAFAHLDDQIEIFHKRSKRILNEEQQRILDETELNNKMIFLGAAGSGKTFVAMEKSKRLAQEGKRVLLTCYNRKLAEIEFVQLSEILTTSNFHNLLEYLLEEKGYVLDKSDQSKYFDETLAETGFDYFTNAPNDEKFDAIIVDEGQDFKSSWITCLESMLTPDGHFYIFADPNQNLFESDLDLLKLPVSKQKLTRNLRNTEHINDWINDLVPEARLTSIIKGGLPVRTFAWDTPEMEKKLIEDEAGRLVSQGISPKRIMILSPNRYENSSLCNTDKIKEWALAKPGEDKPNAIKFETIRSFKGLEADLVFLIGIKPNSRACTDADIYVGASRARFLLYIFHDRAWMFEH